MLSPELACYHYLQASAQDGCREDLAGKDTEGGDFGSQIIQIVKNLDHDAKDQLAGVVNVAVPRS